MSANFGAACSTLSVFGRHWLASFLLQHCWLLLYLWQVTFLCAANRVLIRRQIASLWCFHCYCMLYSLRITKQQNFNSGFNLFLDLFILFCVHECFACLFLNVFMRVRAHVHTHTCAHVHICTSYPCSTWGRQEKVPAPLALASQRLWATMWVLGSKVGSFARATGCFNTEPYLQPQKSFKGFYFHIPLVKNFYVYGFFVCRSVCHLCAWCQ